MYVITVVAIYALLTYFTRVDYRIIST